MREFTGSRRSTSRLESADRSAAVLPLRSIIARLFSTALLFFILSAPARAEITLILVTGAPGEAEFGEEFVKQAAAWREAGAKAGAKLIEIGTAPEVPDKNDAALLREAIAAEPPEGQAALWLVLNGHGTWDGKAARFNLRGPDVTDTDLAAWLKPVHRPAAIINTASSSAPFIAKLSAPGRVVITATRSGSEQNLTRFGSHLAKSLQDPAADLDTDGVVSLLESFLAASRNTAEFYKSEGRLATEHALIDDNGDALATPADWFKGLRAVKKSDKSAAVDGAAARHFYLIAPASDKELPPSAAARREELETRLAALRDAKPSMKEDDYYNKIEPLLIELAEIARDAESKATTPPAPAK